MTRFEFLVREAYACKAQGRTGVPTLAGEVGKLYVDEHAGEQVSAALRDHFFPLGLYLRHHLDAASPSETAIVKAARDLFTLGSMFLRIRKDIDRYFGNHAVTCVNLNGDAFQRLPSGQWCSFCGECCELPGTVPDPPDSVTYPGYWYAYIAGDGPMVQRFCPFLFELPPQSRYFCSIHSIKPLTCRAYGEEQCKLKHPGKGL